MPLPDRPPVIVLLGPTASGKTAAAVALARRLPIEVISADSRQIYRLMDIGTAKPTAQQQQQCPHHFIDIIDITDQYSAGEFATAARSLIPQLRERGKIPAIVGGSGLYIYALCEGIFDFYRYPRKKIAKYRAKLEKQWREQGIMPLYEKLQQVDPAAARRYADRNPRRIIRALEFYLATGIPLSRAQQRRQPPPFQPLYFGIKLERSRLYERINNRVYDMIDQGLVAEVRDILNRGYDPALPALQTMGYKEIIDYLENRISLETAIAQIQRATRRYAKRQQTWFKKYAPSTFWIESEDPDAIAEIIANQYFRILETQQKPLT